MHAPTQRYRGYIFDLDGTIYLGDALLPGAADAVDYLRGQGRKVLFLSNNPTRSTPDYAKKLSELGIPAAPSDLLISTDALVGLLLSEIPGGKLYPIGENPLTQALINAGFQLTDHPKHIDAVIASFDRGFHYGKLQIAFDAIQRGARFFATNADRYCPVPGGGQPDAGAIIAAIEACTGIPVEAVAGKPSAHMAKAALERLSLPPKDCLVIGDRLETDILLGQESGMHTALVLTGAAAADPSKRNDIRPTYTVRNLEELLPS